MKSQRSIVYSVAVISMLVSTYGMVVQPMVNFQILPNEILGDRISKTDNLPNPKFGLLGGEPECYDKLGCFPVTESFCTYLVCTSPKSPESISTKFYLSSRENGDYTELDARYPEKFPEVWPNYLPGRPTKVVVHGFMSDYDEVWMKDMSAALLTQGDYNVILVDWSPGASIPYYQATANTRVVGAQIALLITTIQELHHQSFSNFHIIGHSLGSHIAGYAGERLRTDDSQGNSGPALGRITGLDPAGPYFQSTEPEVRLDRTDAVFVDAIHTDGGQTMVSGFGTLQQMGHADFYPNGGHDQPSCVGEIKDITALLDPDASPILAPPMVAPQAYSVNPACSHSMSHNYFIATILSDCPFLSVQCDNEDDFNSGKCTSGSPLYNRMGFFATKPSERTKYYLMTSSSAPWCQYNNHLAIAFSESSPADWGNLKLRMNGTKAFTEDWIKLSTKTNYLPGDVRRFHLYINQDVGQLTSIEMEYDYEYNPITDWWEQSKYHHVFVDKVVEVQQVESGRRNYFCEDHTDLGNGVEATCGIKNANLNF